MMRLLASAIMFWALSATFPNAARAAVGEDPELSQRGPFAVGTTVDRTPAVSRATITIDGLASGQLPTAERSIAYRIWYPAIATPSGAAPIRYDHRLEIPGQQPLELTNTGMAIADAPVRNGRYPLVLISHGYGGWSTRFSALAETLASHGYVVASIDHNDRPFSDATGFLLSFGNVILDRAQDQRAVLAHLTTRANGEKRGFASTIDTRSVGLIGYSMGGFGALATAGARYDPGSKPIAALPPAARAVLAASVIAPPVIRALVAIAPWGGQADNRAWSAAALAGITAPVLMIAGSEDDVVDYRHGVRWLFDGLTRSDHRLLVYREARHNILGDTYPELANAPFAATEFLAEPVWRADRIASINAHFIIAFLDLTLKGDATRRAWLDVPVTSANAGTWPTSPGEQTGGRVAGAKEPDYWRGFQRRWAVGLEMYHGTAAGAR